MVAAADGFAREMLIDQFPGVLLICELNPGIFLISYVKGFN
jgi:hypothetical protein